MEQNETENTESAQPKSLGARFLEGVKKFFIGLFSLLILIVLVTMAVNWLFFGDDDKPQPQAQEQETYSDIEAYVEAQFIIEDFLKSPATAEYPAVSNATIERLNDDGFKVTSYVDSQNSFGAMVRSEWMVLFQYIGERVKIYQVVIDGEEMYRSDDLD